MKINSPFRFSLKFIVLFVILAAAFEISRGTAFGRLVIDGLILSPTVALLNDSSRDRVTLEGHTIVSGASRMRVVRGCEGVELFLLLLAAIFAYPASLSHQAKGLFFGFLLAYGLSVGRLIVLDDTLRYAPAAWELMHGLIMPLLPVAVLGVYFQRWSTGTLPGPVREASET
jgi:exosortase/archaeosortase family protein